MERLNPNAKEPSSPSNTTSGGSPSPTGSMEKEKKLPAPIEANLGSLCIGSSSPSRELEAQEHSTPIIIPFSMPSPNNNTTTTTNSSNTIKFPVTHHHNNNNKHANSSSNSSSTSSTSTTPSHNNNNNNNNNNNSNSKHSSNSSSTASSSTTNHRIASTPPHRIGNDSASSHSPSSGTTTPPPLMHTPRQLLPSLTPCPLSDLVFVLPGVTIEEEDDFPSSVAKRNSAQTPPNNNNNTLLPNSTQIYIPTRIYAHKTIISERSEYFRVLLTNGMRESSQHEITIPNIDPNIFLSVLRFVYTGELPLSEDTINPLFEACDQFLLESGKNICRTYITQHMPNEVLARFLFEHHTLCSELGSLYLQQAIENAPYFLQSPCVGLLPKDALIRMLHSNDMPLKEIEVFRGVREWIKTNVRIESPPILPSSSSSSSSSSPSYSPPSRTPTLPLSPKYYGPEVLDEIFSLLRFPLMDYDELRNEVESLNLVPVNLLLEAYRFLAKPKTIPLNEFEVGQVRFTSRKKPDLNQPGADVHTFQCREHERCTAVAWPVTHFSSIKTQKHLSNTFDVRGLRWRMWAYPAGEAKHAGSFSVYLEAVRVKERESYDFLRNTTFFFALVNHRNPALSRQYPSTPNVLFNYEKSVWGNGLIELKLLYDKSLGYIESDTVSVHLHLLECIALEG